MAALKSSRSTRGSSATTATATTTGVGVTTISKDLAPKLEENLNVFKSDHFDADAFVNSKCHSFNEKEIRQLCSYLLDLKRASAEEMRRSVYANYPAFIRTSKEISDLEGELSSIRNLVSTQATLIHGLAEGIHIDSLAFTVPDDSSDSILPSTASLFPVKCVKA